MRGARRLSYALTRHLSSPRFNQKNLPSQEKPPCIATSHPLTEDLAYLKSSAFATQHTPPSRWHACYNNATDYR